MRGKRLQTSAAHGSLAGMENITVRMTRDQLHEVDRLVKEWRERTSLAVTRSDVIRMAVSAMVSAKPAELAP